MEVEPLKNGQVDQRLRRRPRSADASPRPTDGFFHSHTLGQRDSQSSPKPRRSPSRTTPNSDHRNGDANGPNDTTALPLGARGKPRLVSAWELSPLIRPLPTRRQQHLRQPRVLSHYPAIVEFVHTNRFVIASQVKRRYSAWLSSPRTAQYQLASLCRLGYLAVAPVRSTGPHFPYVYYATDRGARFVHDEYERLGLSQVPTPADDIKKIGHAFDSILHELMITEFSLWLQRMTDRGDIELSWTERRFFRPERRLRYWAEGRLHKLIPDLGFLVRPSGSDSRGRGLLHFLEWDNGTMSLARIRDKLHQYQVWSGSEQGRAQLASMHGVGDNPRDVPAYRLLFVAHDKNRPNRDAARLVDILGEVLKFPAALRDRVWLTTAAQLQIRGSRDEPDAPIWIRARDMRAWLAVHPQSGSDTPERDRRVDRFRRRHILDHLSRMPRHRLLPRPTDASVLEKGRDRHSLA